VALLKKEAHAKSRLATLGGANMNNKILVAYASKSGSTVDVANTIGKILSEKGASVDVKPIQAVTDLESYQAIVIGSGIRMGQWLSEAVDFVKRNQASLSKIPVALFTVHLLNTSDDPLSRTKREAYTAPIRNLITPRTEIFFAGRLDFSKLSIFETILSKAMHAPEQDLRDWSKIQAWAEALIPTLGMAK
jgi:menaquinone-dependent protoporphyrinogen oxidase